MPHTKKRHKPETDKNWVRNISLRPLDENETHVLSGLPLWLRYVDDTITAVHKNKIDEFHEHLNKQNISIQFTKEIEENGNYSMIRTFFSGPRFS